MKKICEELNLLSNNKNVIRLPLLIKGKIVAPPELSLNQIEEAFKAQPADKTCVKLGNAQVLREPVIDRESMKYTGDHIYQVMAPINPMELIEFDIEKLVKGLYALPFSEVLSYIKSILDAINDNRELVDCVRDLSRSTAEHPDPYHDAAFAGFPLVLDTEMAKITVDTELSIWGKPGHEFLDGWVETPARIFPGMAALMGHNLFKGDLPDGVKLEKAFIRAMPTRQLHITAGNAPAIPVISMLRAMLTKAAAVIKSPYGATIPGALIALAAVKAAPNHPITQNLSIVYWPGGDTSIEDVLFMPTAFDRIVVWGAPDAVAGVRERAKFTRTVCFNPRYGFSFIGKEAFQGNLREVAIRASMDTMIWNQKACIASFVQYVEGTMEQAEEYTRAMKDVLSKWDDIAPNFVIPGSAGLIKRLKRGKYINASWHINKKNDDFSSAAILIPDEFDMMDHPMARTVIVRRVDDLKDAFKFLHHAVSTVGVYPEARRLELRDSILARGVTNVLPLGQCERMYGGMPHDGMMVLNDLVDWKNA